MSRCNAFSAHAPRVVEGGHRAVVFSRLGGVLDTIKGEGLHFRSAILISVLPLF